MKTRILWLSPNSSHEKTPFLNHSANMAEFDLSINSDAGRQKIGIEKLNGDLASHIKTIKDLLTNRTVIERFCNCAKQKGDYLSVQKWVEQMKRSLVNDN